MPLLISTISFFLVLLLFLTLPEREKLRAPIDRLKEIETNLAFTPEGYEKKIEIGPIKRLSKFMPNYENSFTALRRNLIYADSKYALEEVLTVKLMSSVVFALLAYALSKNPIITLLTFFFIWVIPDLLISRMAKKRMVEFNAQLADGMLIICNALKAGYSFMQSMALVSKEMDGPLAKEFGTLIKEMSFGITMEESFNNLNQRVESEDLNLVINAILIQKDVGGNLSEILEKIIETIRERHRIKMEVSTLTAQGRLSGMIITLLPFVLAGFLLMVNPEYIMLLFQTPVGIGMVIYGLISQMIGFFVIRKITDIEL